MKQTFRRNLLRKGSILWKMLLSTVGLICIPLIAIQIFMFVKTSNEFKSSNTKQHEYMLQTLADSFQNEVNTLNQAAIRISFLEVAGTPLDPQASEYEVYTAARALNDYNGVHPLTKSMGIFYPSIDSVYLNGVKKDLAFFCEHYYPPQSTGHQKLQQFIANTTAPGYFMTSAYEGYAEDLLILSKPAVISSQVSVIFFTIDMDMLNKWFSVFVPSGSSFAIMESDGAFIAQGAEFKTENFQTDSYLQFLSDPEQHRYAYNANGAQIVYKYVDSASGRTFLVSIPKSTAEETLINYANEAKIVLVVSVILMAILLTITLYINYKPLFQIMSKHIDSESVDERMSELDILEMHLFSQDERILSQDHLLSSFAIGNILSGKVISAEEAERYFPADTFHYFLAAAADITLSALQSANISNAFQKKNGGKLIITTIPNRPETIFVLASSSEVEIPTFRQELQLITNRVANTTCRINMGSVVTALNQIQLSYYDALFSNKQMDLLGNSDTGETFTVFLQAFEHQIASSEYKEALHTVDELEKILPQMHMATQWYCKFEIVHTYLSAMQKSQNALDNVDVQHLISFKNDTHFFRQLRNSISKNLESLENPTSLSQEERQKILVQYVNQNYLDKSLCLTSVADYLQTSIYTVSRIFKEATGIGFKEYIVGKRIQRACQLLETSDMSIAKIATICAFEDAEYFTIIFKRKFGIPPSKYREDALAKEKQLMP